MFRRIKVVPYNMGIGLRCPLCEKHFSSYTLHTAYTFEFYCNNCAIIYYIYNNELHIFKYFESLEEYLNYDI